MNIIQKRQKRGLNSLIIRLYGFLVLAVYLASGIKPEIASDLTGNLSWVCFPIFAFLIAQGMENSSDKLRYAARLLLFTLLAEIPYNLYKSGKFFYPQAQNGMFTLCLGFAVIRAVEFSYRKLHNMIVSGAATYVLGLLAFRLAKFANFEFWSFGVMFVVLFYICTKTSYPRILMFGFLLILSFYLASETYIIFNIGEMQYTMPHRSLFLFAFIPLCFYNGKRGPNRLWIQIACYAFYPVVLLIMYFLK